MHWRKNPQKLNRRKAIRAELHRRWKEPHLHPVYDWVQGKIRRYYDVVPLDQVHRYRTL